LRGASYALAEEAPYSSAFSFSCSSMTFFAISNGTSAYSPISMLYDPVPCDSDRSASA
jgi:hypothetical protein